MEIIAFHEALVSFGQLSQGLHQRLGHKEAAVLAELDCGFFGYQTMQRITGLYLLQNVLINTMMYEKVHLGCI